MKYSVRADNYHVEFEDHENIRCLEGYFTAKNVDVIFGTITDQYIYVGMHVFGNNTTASGTIKMIGSLTNTANGAQVTPIMPFTGMMNGLQLYSGQRAINWFYGNHVVYSNVYPESVLRMKIDNASVFTTGDIYVRLFFRMK